MGLIRLIGEDFASLELGPFPRDYTAAGEYHYAPPTGYRGIWREPNRDTSWAGRYAFCVKSVGGRRCVEQSIDFESLPWACDTFPLLTAGDVHWADYTLSAEVEPLSLRAWAGIAFRYVTSRDYCLFALDGGCGVRLYSKRGEEFELLAEAAFPHGANERHTLTVEVSGGRARCLVDGAEWIRYEGIENPRGKIGLSALAPARFSGVTLDMDAEAHRVFYNESERERAAGHKRRETYPPMRLWKVLDFKDHGTARSIRFGDLRGTGETDLVLIQPEEALSNADETGIGCLTAIDLSGNALWRIGEARRGPHLVTKDLPAQIYDIDGDGRDEVIYARDFKLVVADGATGKTKYSADAPESVYTDEFKIMRNVAFHRIQVDAISIITPAGPCGLPHKPRERAAILVKDRYNNLWLYDRWLKPLWHLSLNTGHFPIPASLRGVPAILAGHSAIVDGKILWTLPDRVCHVDEIIPFGDRIAYASGEDGFLVASDDGRILFRDEIGHAQRISMGNYRPDLPGLETCAVTFWRNSSLLTMYGADFNKLFTRELSADGNVIAPVDWMGDGSDLLLYSASNAHGGLYDGHGELAVPFPSDGHPELCCDAIDLFGDSRDELLAWDETRMYVYTQADAPREGLTAAPVKAPRYNASNYRGEYAFRGPAGHADCRSG